MKEKRKVILGVIALIAAAIIVMVGVYAVLGVVDNGNQFSSVSGTDRTGDLVINVESDHILLSANYTLYVDGKQVGSSFALDSGQSKEFAQKITVPAGKSSVSVAVLVKSTGGGFGNEQDSKTANIYADTQTRITLSA